MLNGIDVSGWQKGINLAIVPSDFVICKATEGTSFVSDDFYRQIKQAKGAGKLLGVYHYANGGNYMDEANHFLKTVKDYIGKAILFLDWEGEGNRSWNTSKEKTWVQAWCDYVKEKTGIKPIIYTSASAMNRVKGLGYDDFWIAQYANYTRTGYQSHPWNEGAYKCLIRQYSSAGRLSGYNGNLDLNLAYMSKSEWKEFATGGKTEEKKKKSITTIAKEVIAGKWGVDAERKKKLAAAGYDYAAVQKKVNELLKPTYNIKLPSSGSLKKGSKGDSVKELQKMLNDRIGAGLKVDGIYGAKTETAVKKFQKKYKIKVDGIFGKQSLSKV